MVGFLVLVAVMLAVDLGLVNKKNHVVSLKEALVWTGVWIGVAMLFWLFLFLRGELLHGVEGLSGAELAAYRRDLSLEYLTGYLIEKALSVDNIFVMIMIFLSFRVDPKYYHKILFWGIVGAVVLRFAFIFTAAALVSRFAWVLWIFGGILVFSGIKMFFEKSDDGGETKDMKRHPLVRFISKRFRMTRSDYGGKFFVRLRRHLYLTPLFLVLVVIEASDVIFAVDSIPAIFSVTLDPYIVFFSNIFAILGLRSLFFVLSGVMDKFVWLKTGLAVLLTFIGVKMLLPVIGGKLLPLVGVNGFDGHISTPVSLMVVVGILAVSIIASLIFPKREAAKPTTV
jgi:tellurite resistance protein TerC